MTETGQVSPGFQGSETTSCEVIIYGRGEDPVILGADESVVPFDGRYRNDAGHSLVSVSTNKALGQTGSFSIQVKPSRSTSETLFDRIVDNDWIDIVFKRHGRVWHTVRGLVDAPRRRRVTSNKGVTSTTHNITGRDFQKIFEETPIWFNRFTGENVEGSAALRVYSFLPNISGDPADTVQAILIGFLQELSGLGRANWTLPDTMANTSGSFIEDIQAGFSLDGFSGVPDRIGINPNLAEPNGTIWSLAREWSDQAFTELWCDLANQGSQLQDSEELAIDDSTMTVFFRDKPFPLTSEVTDDQGVSPPPSLGLEKDSAWFSLPLFILPRQQIKEDDIGRSGEERINSFFVAPQLTQELAKTGTMDLVQPLWNSKDILRHGFRRYDIMSHYKAREARLITLATIQRLMVRDWYAINPYLLNGTIQLGMGRPDIRVGSRVRIPGDGGETLLDETYYVEQVSHNWVFGSGLKTQLGVTRGWIGTDDDLLSAMKEINREYQPPPRKVPEEFAIG
jgi:hypothetical protein